MSEQTTREAAMALAEYNRVRALKMRDMKVGDYIDYGNGRIGVVYKTYNDMGPNIHGYSTRPATKVEKLKFRFWRLIRR